MHSNALNIGIFAGGLSWPLYIALDQGIFGQEGIQATLISVPDSVDQITGLMDGRYDIVMTPFDNVVAYQEAQGEVQLREHPDLFAFMGGIRSSLRLLSSPGVRSFEALRGASIGVDAEHTGYTLALYQLLAQNGLSANSCSLVRTGGTTFRVKSLNEGTIQATMVSSPQEIGPEEHGCHRIGDVEDMIGEYQALCGVARRSWAAHSSGLLCSFIRAYVAATDLLFNDVETAVRVFQKYVPEPTASLAGKAHAILTSDREGFQPKAKFSVTGAATVLRIRSRFGTPARSLPNWAPYLDESFYHSARRQRP